MAVTQPISEQKSSSPRYIHLDWIRTIAILNLIPFHVATFLIYIPGFAGDRQAAISLKLLSGYISLVSPLHMPLLFLVAGYSVALALPRKSIKSYLRERLQRLLVPTITYIVFLGPIVRYLLPSDRDRSLTDLLQYYATSSFELMGKGKFYDLWHHLWFVVYLFIFVLFSLPLLSYFDKSIRGKTFFSSSLSLLLPSFIFAGVFAFLVPVWRFGALDIYTDWTYFIYNFAAFILGYVLCIDAKAVATIDRYLALCTAVFIVSTGARMWLCPNIGFTMPNSFNISYFQYGLYSAIAGFSTWSFLVASFGLSKRFLGYRNRFIRYASQASYFYYIFHVVTLMVLGYLIPLRLGILLDFFSLSILTFLLTGLIFEIVRCFKIARLLFGIKKMR